MKLNRIMPIRFLTILGLLLFGILLIGCDEFNSKTTSIDTALDYSNFSSLRVSDPYMQLNMSDDPYYLYYYSESCGHCNIIKPEVLLILSNLTESHVFLVETNSLADISPDIDVSSTPALVYVVNHQVEQIFVGQTEVLDEFYTLR